MSLWPLGQRCHSPPNSSQNPPKSCLGGDLGGFLGGVGGDLGGGFGRSYFIQIMGYTLCAKWWIAYQFKAYGFLYKKLLQHFC